MYCTYVLYVRTVRSHGVNDVSDSECFRREKSGCHAEVSTSSVVRYAFTVPTSELCSTYHNGDLGPGPNWCVPRHSLVLVGPEIQLYIIPRFHC
jgi:hypothetical protein